MSSPIAQAGRLVRTVRHLRPRQVAHRLLRLMVRPRGPRHVDAGWDPERGARLLSALAGLGPVGGPRHAESSTGAWLAGRLTWLGLEVPWTGDWRMPGPSPLWRYHLLYHEHLADAAWIAHRDADRALAQRIGAELDAWSAAWGDGGAPAWDGYPVAVRLVSWLRILAWAGPLLDESRRRTIQSGIAVHTAHLHRALEWHIDGNHLLRDTWALALGAAALEAPWAARLAPRARALFERVLREQVGGDGWHEERSPMYHARALRDALEVQAGLTACGRPVGAGTPERIHAMEQALPWMLRADGSLWQLNDTAGDHGVDLAPLLNRADRGIEGVRHFQDARTAVLADRDGDRLRLDLGAPAPAHQPGHAHAGSLGFELDLGGVPCVVDRGVSGYDGDPWRAHLRGSAAHSTVSVDGRDQSELWATFRVGGRARVEDVVVEGGTRRFRASATCVPYHDRGIAHRREFTREGRAVTITDQVDGAAGRRVEAFVHLDPSWEARTISDREFEIRHRSATATIRVDGPAGCSLHRGEQSPPLGWHARGFNDVVPAWTLRLREDRYVGASWRVTITPR